MTPFWCYIVGSYLGNYLMMRWRIGFYGKKPSRSREFMIMDKTAAMALSPIFFIVCFIYSIAQSTCPKEESDE